jgi:hypothetical protein
MEEGAGATDAEACPIAMSAKDTSGASSSISPTVDATTCVDGGSDCAVSAYDTMTTPSHATPAMGALDVPPSIHPAIDVTAYADGGSNCATFACDVVATPGHATSATGALDAPSSVCSPLDVATSRASPVDAVATLAPLLITSGVAPADSWCARWWARFFFGSSLRGVPPSLAPQKTRRSSYGKIHQSEGVKKFSTHLSATRW